MESGAAVPVVKRKNKGLIIALIVLVLVIVGLIVWAVIAKLLPTDPDPTDSSDLRPYQSMHAEALEGINEKAETMTMSEAKQLYEQVINDASDETLVTEARVEYARYLLSNYEFELALEQFNSVDVSTLDVGYQILFYAGMREYYDYMEDEEAYEEYNNKVREVITNSDFARGG